MIACIYIEPPDAPNITINEVTLTSIIISWTIPALHEDDTIQEYEVLFNNSVESIAADADRIFTANGLTENTVYTFEVRAVGTNTGPGALKRRDISTLARER